MVKDEENVDFDEFLSAVRTILMFENFFDELDLLFRHLDSLKTGKIKIKELVDACNKLSSPEMVGQHEMRVPSGAEIDVIYKKMTAAASIETAG
jgi:Ca2+-binding EF-hand superfamily protein